MARSSRQRYVRQMPRIYGNLQRPKRDFGAFFRTLRNLFWLLAVAAGAYAVFFSGWFSVRQVQVEGVLFAPKEQVQTAVPLGSNLWLLSQQQASSRVMRYPSVESVSVLRGLPDHVRIAVVEKQPALVWLSGNDALVLDNSGMAFARFGRADIPSGDTPLGAALAGIPRVYDVKAVPVKVGQQVASASFVRFISETRRQWAELLPQATLSRFEISETTYDVTVYTEQGLRVQLSSLADAGVQVRNLTRLIHQGYANLNSTVDLRVDRWAYVK